MIKNPRSAKLLQQTAYSASYKFGALLIGFWLVPISIDILGASDYGLWLTFFSIFTWVLAVDVSIGYALRNMLTQAISKKKTSYAGKIIATAIFVLTGLALGAAGLIYLIFFFLEEMNVLVGLPLNPLSSPWLLATLFLQILINPLLNIYLAHQDSSIIQRHSFYVAFLSLVVLLASTTVIGEDVDLVFYAIVVLNIPIIISALYVFKALFRDNKYLLLGFFEPSAKVSNILLKHGLQFLIIQLGFLSLFATDNILIINIFNAEDVVMYAVSLKYFSIISIAFGLMMTPLWSSYTDAAVKNDKLWIRKNIKFIFLFWLIIVLPGLFLLLVMADFVVETWLGEKLSIPILLHFIVATMIMLRTFLQINMAYLNAVGDLNIQVWISLMLITLNIPLSIFFAIELGLGLIGIPLATCLLTFVQAVIMCYRVFYLLREMP